jgi:hypothetical protein
MKVELNCPCEDLLEQRLEFLGDCHSVLSVSEVPYIYLPFNFVQILLQTFQDVVLSAEDSLNSAAAARLVQLLGLIHFCVVEDQSTLLLCEDFIQTFVQCFNCLLKFTQEGQVDLYSSFRHSLFSFLQTNYALGELYAAHVDIEQYRWLNNFLRYILEIYRGVFALASGPQDFFYEVTLSPYSDLLPSTLAHCFTVSVAHNLPVLDFYSLTLAQLRKLATRLTDELDVSILKSIIFDLAFPLLLSLYTFRSDLSLKPALIFKSVQMVEFVRHLSSKADGGALVSNLKDLFHQTVIAYVRTGSTSAKLSFMDDRHNDISSFFRYVLDLDLKLFIGTEHEASLMAKFEVLSVPEVVEAAQVSPPIVQAYSLEFIDRYLEDCINHSRSFSSLVACGLCETLFETFLFDLPVLREASVQTSEFRRSVTTRSQSVIMKLLVSSASQQQVLSSLRLGVARHWHKLSYQLRAFELLDYLTLHETMGQEVKDILLEDRLLLFYLQLLDDHILVESGEMEVVVACTVLHVISCLISFKEFTKELEQVRGLFCKMCGDADYYKHASTHLFPAFKFLGVDTPLYSDLIAVIGTLHSPSHITGLITAFEQALIIMPDSWHKIKVQVRLLAEYPEPILAKASELQELSIVAKALKLYHHIRTGLDRDKETSILINTVKCMVKLISRADYALPELIVCLEKLFSLAFTPVCDNLIDCAYPALLPSILEVLVACKDDGVVKGFIKKLWDRLEGSLYTASSFSRFIDPQLVLSLMDRSELVPETTQLVAAALKYYCRPHMLRALLSRLNTSIQEQDEASVYAVIACLKTSASQANAPYKLQKSLAHLHWPRVPACTLHFSSVESCLIAKCGSKLFDESSCSLQFWLFPQAQGDLVKIDIGDDKSLKIVLQAEGDLRLIFTRGQPDPTKSESGAATDQKNPIGVVFWNSWNLVTLKMVKNLAKFIVNSTSYETSLLEFVPADEFNDCPPTVTLGCSDEGSFIGEITHFGLVPGIIEDQQCLDLYTVGFTSPLDLASDEVSAFHLSDEQNEALSPLIELLRSKAILYLTSQGTEEPVAYSLAAVKAKQREARGTNYDSLSVSARKVYVSSGATLLQAFHAVGGIKVLMPLIGRVAEVFPKAEGAVTDLLTVVCRLLRTKHALSMLEVAKDSLLDILGAQLQHLAEKAMVSPRTLKVIEKIATLPWLFHRPKSIASLTGEEEWRNYLENPPSIRLMTDYKVWRSLDQGFYYERVQLFASRRLFSGSLMYPLRLQILHYFFKVARGQEKTFVALDSEEFKAGLMLHLSTTDLVNCLALELQQPKENSIAALHFQMSLLSQRQLSDFQEYVGASAPKVAWFVTYLGDLADYCREGLPEVRYQHCIHLVAQVLMVIMELRVKRQSQEASVLEELKDTIFNVAALCSREKMNSLLFQFYRKHKVEVPVSSELLSYFEILFRDDVATHAQDRDSVYFATEILIDLLRAPTSSLQFAKDYEAVLGFTFKKLMDPARGEVFAVYLHSIVEMLLQVKLNELLGVFLLYFIEDLTRNFPFQVSLPLIGTLIDQLRDIGVDFDRAPPMPVFTEWNSLLNAGPSTPMTSFQMREGGTVRAVLNLLLRLLSQQADKALDENSVNDSESCLVTPAAKAPRAVVELLVKYLRLNKSQEPLYLFANYVGLQPIKGALALRYPELERDGDLFGSEQGVWAFVFAELCELMLAHPDLRAIHEVSALVIDLLLARDPQGRSIVNLYLSKAFSHDYTSWLRAVYHKLSSVHAPEGFPRKRFVEYCLESFAMAGADYHKIEQQAFYKLETQLKQMRQDRDFGGLFGVLEDRSSDLARLHDFCIAYTSMKVKLIELLLPEKTFVQSQSSAPRAAVHSPYRTRPKDSGHKVYFSDIIKTNRNSRLLGRYKLQVLVRALSRKGEVWSKDDEVRFWRLSPVTDGLGRRTRLIPSRQGSTYEENVNRKYRPEIPKHSQQLASSFDAHSKQIRETLPLSKAHTEQGKQQPRLARALLSCEEFSISTSLKRHCLIYNCERIQICGVNFGRLELYWNVIIFRSTGQARPNLPQFELGALSIFQKPRESLLVFSMREVEEVIWKRFMHTRAALEIFMKNGRSYLFNIFDPTEFARLRTFFLSEAEALIQFKECSADQATQLSKKWKSGTISNFEYLMQLNKFSSRSYNDLNQYPVFPWILTNYQKDTTDWTDTDFRDLTKPIGALDEDSKVKAVARYKQLEQVEGMLPYNYGTHYTSGGVVLYYLLRLEPYSNQAVLLHDNKFDIADRLFSSIRSGWECTLKNYADNKELVPEFFCLAEGFLNLHNYNLGWKQTGAHVHDVEMPPWACYPMWPRMDAYRFVYYHKKALEHQQVSSKLPGWIDLIFGEKQSSKEDINVYPALSYEQNFATRLAECEAEGLPKVTLLTEVAHYGQTPIQLFDRAHKHKPIAEKRKKTIFSEFSWNALQSVEPPPAGFDLRQTKKIGRRFEQVEVLSIQVTSGLSLVVYQYDGETCLHLFDGSKANCLKKLGLLQIQDTCALEDISPFAGRAVAASIVGGDWLITGLHNDNSFRLYKASIRPLRLALKQTVKFHTDVVCCLGFLADSKLVTGSKDGVLALWEVSLGKQESIVKYRATLRGHSTEILKVEGNADLELVCSLSRDGLLLLHDLRTGELFNSLRPPCSQVNTFAMSSQGLLAVSVDDSAPRVLIYSTNGELGRGPLQDMNFLHFDWYSTMKACGDIAVDSVFQMQFNLEGDYLMAASPSFFTIFAVFEPLHLPFLYPARQHVTAFALDQDESRVMMHLHRTTFVLVSKSDDSQRRRMNSV